MGKACWWVCLSKAGDHTEEARIVQRRATSPCADLIGNDLDILSSVFLILVCLLGGARLE